MATRNVYVDILEEWRVISLDFFFTFLLKLLSVT